MMIPGLRRRCCCISELNEQNSRKEIKALSADGLPGLEDTDVRNQWLNTKSVTFSNVYEKRLHILACKVCEVFLTKYTFLAA